MRHLWIDAIALLAVLISLAGLLIMLRRSQAQIARLRQQEEQLRSLSRAVEQSPSVVMIANLDGNIEYVNPKFTAITGYTLDEIKGKNPRILKSGHTSNEEYWQLWNTIASGGAWHGEFLNKKKNGELYWEAASISPVKNSAGTITHYVAVKEDITARKEAAEQVIRQNRELALLNRVIEAATSTLDITEMLTTICRELALTYNVPQAATALLNPDGTTYEVVAEYLAPGRTSALGVRFPIANNPIVEYVMQDPTPLVMADVRTDQRWPITEENRKNIEARGTISMLIVPLLVNHQLVGTIGLDSLDPRIFSEDEIALASRVAAALSQSLHNSLLYRKLRASEARSENLLAALPDLVFHLNRAGVYLDTRGDMQHRLRSYDEPLSHVIGRTIFEFLPPPVAEVIHQKIVAALDTGEVQSAEYELETLSGHTYFEARLTPIGPDEVISVARDNTKRKLAEAERERLINELDAFAHTVAHDLKNPLQGIVGYASLLVNDIDQFGTADLVRYLQVIIQYGERMSGIINELLLLASVRKQGDVEFGSVDMAQVIKNVLLRLDYMIRQEHAEINIHTRHWPPTWGYAPWIEEVWANYISNAIKYGGKPPCIGLGADELDGRVRFWVQDNGAGIPPDKMSQLFTEFTRLEQARLEGYGLGLSIVRRVIERLGGEVGVESTPGEGSIFFFSLPIAAKPETTPHA